jgi:glutaconate CoA-transferase, subunit A
VTAFPTSTDVMGRPAAGGRHVQDGMSIAPEGFGHLTPDAAPLVPRAAGRSSIRQRRRGLTLCRMAPRGEIDPDRFDRR